MITISLCMIVKNEEHHLPRCLESIKGIADEIIMIDTGSTDNTKQVAREYTSHIQDFQWRADFSAARNFSFEQATQEYILWLDADDILLPKDRDALLKLKQTLSSDIDSVYMPYHTAFDANGNVMTSTKRMRLVKRSKPFKWEGIVHETLACKEKYKYLNSDICVTHMKNMEDMSNRNLAIYIKALEQGHHFVTHDLFHYALELMLQKSYNEAIPLLEECLQREDISLENKIFVYHKLATCYRSIGNEEKEAELTIQSFQLDIPQPAFCCRMGEFFDKDQKYEQAIFWYKLAVEMPVLERYSHSVEQPAFRTWYPHKQLGKCYFYLGDYQSSYEHNQAVLTYKPDDKETLQNMTTLTKILHSEVSV